MIRLIIGLIVVLGAVGGLEQDTATFFEATMFALVGLSLMAWPIVDGTVNDEEFMSEN